MPLTGKTESQEFSEFIREKAIDLVLPKDLPEDTRSFVISLCYQPDKTISNIKNLLERNPSLADQQLTKEFIALLKKIVALVENENIQNDPKQSSYVDEQIIQLTQELNSQKFKLLLLNLDFSNFNN